MYRIGQREKVALFAFIIFLSIIFFLSIHKELLLSNNDFENLDPTKKSLTKPQITETPSISPIETTKPTSPTPVEPALQGTIHWYILLSIRII